MFFQTAHRANLFKPPHKGRTGMRCGMLTSTVDCLRVHFLKRRTTRLFTPPHKGRTGMRCGMLTSTFCVWITRAPF